MGNISLCKIVQNENNTYEQVAVANLVPREKALGTRLGSGKNAGQERTTLLRCSFVISN